MKVRLLLTLAGLAIGFAVPPLAFEGNLAGDVKALDEFGAFGKKYDEAYKESDAAALAAGPLFINELRTATEIIFRTYEK